MPRNQHHPTPEELDERVKLDLDPDEAIRLILETGEGSEDDRGAGEGADEGVDPDQKQKH